MHLDVQVCVPCMLTGVGGVLGAFQYSVSYCLETRSLAEEEASLSLSWAARELSRSVCTPTPWCWGCWHVQTCVTFYMNSRDLNSGFHTCHPSEPTHWTICWDSQYTQKLQSVVLSSVVSWSGFGPAACWPHTLSSYLCTPSEKDERTGLVSCSEWEGCAPLIYFLD